MSIQGPLVSRGGLVALLVAAASLSARAQQQPAAALTAADYARAERFMPYNTNPLVLHSAGRVTWVADQGHERFWYRTTTEKGAEAIMVSAEDGAKSACDLAPCRAAVESGGGRGGAATRLDVPSPDGKRTAFIREWNLWVRDVASGRETALTTDGVKDFGYATDNAGWTRSDRPILVWSPDSKKIATFQQDQRGVGEMYLVNTTVGHPTLQAWKYPLPGDEVVTTIQRVIIEVDIPRVIR